MSLEYNPPGHSAVKNANTDSNNYYSNHKHTATSNIYNITAYAKYYFTMQWLKHFTKLKLLFLTLMLPRQIYQFAKLGYVTTTTPNLKSINKFIYHLNQDFTDLPPIQKNELIFLRKLSALWDSMYYCHGYIISCI